MCFRELRRSDSPGIPKKPSSPHQGPACTLHSPLWSRRPSGHCRPEEEGCQLQPAVSQSEINWAWVHRPQTGLTVSISTALLCFWIWNTLWESRSKHFPPVKHGSRENPAQRCPWDWGLPSASPPTHSSAVRSLYYVSPQRIQIW